MPSEPGWSVLGLGVYSTILLIVLVILCFALLVLAVVVKRWRKKRALTGLPTAVGRSFVGGLEEQPEYVHEVALVGARLPCHTSEIYYTLPQLHGRHNGIRLQTFSREVM
ncbi:hypothetical protein IscW_ISCW006816 [Ixodes scapularis]|uniref:Uncharacterized protein n=1 Tax=Ixodes scapularis TaxID=6945 RepID=B7PMY0_IXOSC|nr:hypothetical protein IscW_ISCW006816 [Ixodes scapularis]|eukprot:XP_002435128.1 hypothetical protein IscW_ISCW006816 [Ixodes scapularis]